MTFINWQVINNNDVGFLALGFGTVQTQQWQTAYYTHILWSGSTQKYGRPHIGPYADIWFKIVKSS